MKLSICYDYPDICANIEYAPEVEYLGVSVFQDDGKDKALRSSQAFFSQLQDQVKSQIKSAKDQSSKKKKLKEVSVSKLKL